MATKKKRTTKELKGLTKRQDNIIRLRKKLNQPDPDAVKPFTAYKVITYFCIVFLPPLAIYRLWCKKSTFKRSEQMVETAVCLIYVFVLVARLLQL